MTARAAGAGTQPEGRSVEARLARLHLRTGMLALARAELETLAARGELDSTALADLAEARWRSGDLRGVAVRLGIILRDEGALAPLVLSLADRALARSERAGATAAALHLVRGDAFRSMGREIEASAAFQRSRQALTGAALDEGES